ncbi:alpha/beta hydrolase [Gymnodinialimonas sp.]
MSVLTPIDRLFALYAKSVERSLLWLVASQPLARRIFALTAPLTCRMPKGTTVEILPGGSQILTPQGTEGKGFFFYIHGGGFTIGSPGTHRAMVAHIAAAAGLRAYLVRYPLAPEHPCPAASDAVFAAYQQLVQSGDAPIAIGGDSAGGNLAVLTLQRARDAGLPLPKAATLIAPIADLSDSLEARFSAAPSERLIPAAWAKRIERAYLPGVDASDPSVSPLNGDLTGLPPTLLQAAEGEVLAQDAAALAARMDDASLDLWPGLQHVWHLKAGVAPAATQACNALGSFLKAHT